MLLAGIDEAGYGPTLGPMCHGLCVFRVPDQEAAPDLWEGLPSAVGRAGTPDVIEVDDSKRIFAGPQKRERLRRTVMAFLALLPDAMAPRESQEALSGLLDPSDMACLNRDPWGYVIGACPPAGLDAPTDEANGPCCVQRDARKNALPPAWGRADVSESERGERGRPRIAVPFAAAHPLQAFALRAHVRPLPSRERASQHPPCAAPLEVLKRAMAARAIELLALRTCALDARRFNQRLDVLGNKADVAWEPIRRFLLETIALARPGEMVRAVVDRQGGRKFYAGRLVELSGVALPEVEAETAVRSAYRVMVDGRALRIEFLEKAESKALPVALASMAAKWTRELCMERFNAYFQTQDPALRPTAGYPEDAARFLKETADLRRRLGIEDESLIRRK